MLTQREYDEIELRNLERRLAEIEEPSRQTDRTDKGDAFRASLEADIERLRTRLSSEKE